jgi:hypothetical protein
MISKTRLINHYFFEIDFGIFDPEACTIKLFTAVFVAVS